MIESYQEEQSLLPTEPPDQSFAVIGEIYDDGISLIFNGASQPSLKHYKCNASIPFQAGQRVRIIEDSGTYVVEYPIGAPAKTLNADSAVEAAYAANAGHAATATSAEMATTAETAVLAQRAETADVAQTANRHTANTIGFFGQSPITRVGGVASVSTDATLAQVITQFNKLISALDYRGYGLID